MGGRSLAAGAKAFAAGAKFLAAGALLLLGTCLGPDRPARAGTPAPFVPEILNTRAVYSKTCSEILYSSNKHGSYRPFSLKRTDAGVWQPGEIPLQPPHDHIARSLSHDCRFVATVSDVEEDGRYGVFLVERGKPAAQRISLAGARRVDEGEPLMRLHRTKRLLDTHEEPRLIRGDRGIEKLVLREGRPGNLDGAWTCGIRVDHGVDDRLDDCATCLLALTA